MTDGVMLSSLTVSTTLDASGYAAGAAKKAAADQQMIGSGESLADNLDLTQRRLTDSGTSFDKFVRSVDPAAASAAKFESGMARVQSALDAGVISTERAAELVAILEQRYVAATAAIEANASALEAAQAVSAAYQSSISGAVAMQERLTTSLAGTSDAVKAAYAASITPIDQTTAAISRSYQASLTAGQADRDNLATRLSVAAAYTASLSPVQNLTEATEESAAAHAALSAQGQAALHTLRDLAVQVPLGVPPVMLLTQQLGHLSFAASGQGGISGAFGEAIAILGGFITPTTLAVGAGAALTAGLVALAARASDADAQTRTYSVALNAMGTSSQTTATDLEQVAKSLEKTGTSADDAQKSILAFIRTPGLNPSSAGSLLPLAQDIGAGTGDDIASVAQKMATAFASGTNAAIQFAFAISGPNGLTAAQAASARAMDQQGDRAGALQVIIDALHQHFDGLNQQSLSPTAKAINSVSTAWDNMLTSLSNTTAVQTAKTAIVTMLNAVATALNPSTSTQSPEQQAAQMQEASALGIPASAMTTPPLGYQTGQPVTSMTSSAATSGLPGGIADYNLSLSSSISALISVPGQYADAIQQAAQKYGIPADLLAGMIASESGFDPNAISSVGARGIAQFIPSTAQQYGVDVNNPTSSIFGAAHYLSDLYQQTGSYATALGDYVSGNPNYQFQPSSSYVKTGTLGLAQQYDAMLSGGSSVVSNALSQEDIANLQAATNKFNALNTAASEFGKQGVFDRAYWNAFYSDGKSGWDQITDAWDKGKEALATFNTESQRSATLQDAQTQGVMGTAQAYLAGEIPGLQAAAKAQADLEAMQGQTADAATRAQQILAAQAATAISSAAASVPALGLQATAIQNLADAAAKGTSAEHDAQIQNQITAQTHEVLAKAIASGNPALIQEAQAVTDATAALIKKNDAAQTALQINQQINTNNNQIQVYQTEAQFAGQTTEQINLQVGLLQAQQFLQSKGVDLSSQEAQNYLKSVAALGQANIALGDANANAQRVNSTLTSIGNTIDSDITNNLEAAFSGQQVTSWGTIAKQVIAQIEAQLISLSIIKPAIGSVLSLLGFSGAAQSFGSLFSGSGLLSSLGSLFGGSSSLGGISVKQNSDGTLTLLGNGASLASNGSSLFGGSGGFLGGVGDWLNSNIGASLGFYSGAPVDGLIGPPAPGLFGTTTLTGALGLAGLGGTVGSLFGLLTGNTGIGSTILSGAGGLVGGLAGSSLLGTVLGSAAGPVGAIAGGLLGNIFGGLFGGTPPNNETAGTVDLTSGSISGVQSHGVAQNDQNFQSIATAIGQFASSINQLLPGALSGTVVPQAGSRDGIKIEYGGQTYNYPDVQTAINQTEEMLLQNLNLSQVSDTIKTVLSQITDPSQLQSAIQFADAYDNLKTAADSAFASVETATQTTEGPFEQAIDQITTIFSGLTTQAQQFGLSLDPINSALTEAANRLTGDFTKAIFATVETATQAEGPYAQAMDQITEYFTQLTAQAQQFGTSVDAINSALAEATTRLQGDFKNAIQSSYASASGFGYLNDIQSAVTSYSTNTQEAAAIGLGNDPVEGNVLGQLFNSQISSILSQLNPEQIIDAVAQYGSTLGYTDFNQLAQQYLAQNSQAAQNSAAGKSYLSDIQAALNSYSSSTTVASTLGASSSIQDQLGQAFDATIQEILSPLSVDQLNDVISAFGQLGYTDLPALANSALSAAQAASDAATAQQNANDILAAGTQIRTYLNSLETAQSAFVSPASQLSAAQAQYQTQLGLAQSGNVTALQGITGVAQTLLQAVSGYYASSAPGQAIFGQVQNDLAALPGVPSATQTQTNAIVSAVTGAASDQTSATAAAALQIVSATTAASTSIVNGATTGAASISGATTAAINDNTTSQDSGFSALLAANVSQSQALIAQNAASSAAIIASTNASAAAITGQDNTSTQSIVTSAAVSSAQALAGANSNAAALGNVIGTWSGAVVQAVANADAGIVNMLGTNSNAVTSAIFSSSDIGVGAVYGASSNVIGAIDVLTSELPVLGDVSNNIANSNVLLNQILQQIESLLNTAIQQIEVLINRNEYWNSVSIQDDNRRDTYLGQLATAAQSAGGVKFAA